MIINFGDAIRHVNILRSTNNSKINSGEKTSHTTAIISNHKTHFLNEKALICLNRVTITRKKIGLDGQTPDNTQSCIIYSRHSLRYQAYSYCSYVSTFSSRTQRCGERALGKLAASLQVQDKMSYIAYA